MGRRRVSRTRAGRSMQQDVSSAESSVTVLTVSSSSGEGVVTVTAKPNKTTWIVYVVTPTQ